MVKERLIVVGGNAAGMSAASQAGRQNPGLQILAFEESPMCPTPPGQFLLHGRIVDDPRLWCALPEALEKRDDVQVFHRISGIDLHGGSAGRA
jgi:hypothetical protein